MKSSFGAGCEYVVDAYGCAPHLLTSRDHLAALASQVVLDLQLRQVGDSRWHTFGSAGGVTGLLLLAESHLALHTFPETHFATFNLYHCQPRPPWPWRDRLSEWLGATHVSLRVVARGEWLTAGRPPGAEDATVGPPRR